MLISILIVYVDINHLICKESIVYKVAERINEAIWVVTTIFVMNKISKIDEREGNRQG